MGQDAATQSSARDVRPAIMRRDAAAPGCPLRSRLSPRNPTWAKSFRHKAKKGRSAAAAAVTSAQVALQEHAFNAATPAVVQANSHRAVWVRRSGDNERAGPGLAGHGGLRAAGRPPAKGGRIARQRAAPAGAAAALLNTSEPFLSSSRQHAL